MALYELSENCDYGTMKNEMIRGHIVVGIQDSSLSERLQLDAELTLEKAKKAVHQREAVHEQNQPLACSKEASSNLAPLKPGYGPKKQNRGEGKPHTFNRTQPTCSRCGKEPHAQYKCPAKGSKPNHYAAVCRTKPASNSEVTCNPTQSNVDDVAFLDHITPS